MMKLNIGNSHFIGTEWLKLELAIDLIGDMIAFNSERLHIAIKSNADEDLIASIENELIKLGHERQRCYECNANDEIILKAHMVYGPELRQINLMKNNRGRLKE